jgi:hypothetical protein
VCFASVIQLGTYPVKTTTFVKNRCKPRHKSRLN